MLFLDIVCLTVASANSYGHAVDPSVGSKSTLNKVVTELQLGTKPSTHSSFDEPTDRSVLKAIQSAAAKGGASVELMTVFESAPLRPGDKRKRAKAFDPSDIEGWKGPWTKYAG
jgi:hypothetical protein